MTSGFPSFKWLSIPSIDACNPDTISWNYTGPDLLVSIHLSPTNASSDIPTNVGTTLATRVNVADGRWTWTSANVTAGRYYFFINDFFYARSPFFTVSPGTVSSCTHTVSSGTTIPAVTASTPSSEPRPAGDVSTSSSSSASRHAGAIAGGTVAAGLVLALVLLFLARAWNRRRRGANLRAWRRLEEHRRPAPARPGHERQSSIAKSPIVWDEPAGARGGATAQMPAEPPSAYRLDWSPTSPRSPFDDTFGIGERAPRM